MTSDQFFKRLAKFRGKFRVNQAGHIRLPGRDNTCPVVAVSGGTGANWESAAKALGLRYSFADEFTFAADNMYGTSYRVKLRRRMLRVLGLEERA